MKKVKIGGLFLLAMFLLMLGFVQAENIAVPAAINYQGKLTNPSDGTPVQAGVYHLEFRVWSDPTDTAEANLIWGRVFAVHVMTNGVFNILLTDDGTEVTAPSAQTNDIRQAFQGENRYLGLTLTHGPSGAIASPEISPRQRMVSAPFAFHAQNATDAFHAEEADEAVLAQNSEKLDGKLAGSYYDKDSQIVSHHNLEMESSTIVPAEGSTKGIRFPANIGGGTGDDAGLEYFVAGNTEDCELRLFVGNDHEDKMRIDSSGDIEINARKALVLKNSDTVEAFGNSVSHIMNQWYEATGDGMVTYYGWSGTLDYYHWQKNDFWVSEGDSGSVHWNFYFENSGADTFVLTMPVGKGDKINFSGSGPRHWKIRWKPFGNASLVYTTDPRN